jgi:hypothetical protein
MAMGTMAQADTYYVATDGSDENPGGMAEPLRTIQKAADTARAGDTILVRGGVYREAVVLRFSGQEGKPIVLKNYPGERPVIQPGEPGKQPPGQGVRLQAQEGYQKPIGWITIEGLEIRHGWDGVKIYNAHDITIRSCHIHESWNQGILGNGNRVLIDRNIIAGNGTDKKVAQNLMHGIYATGSAFTITNNLIHSNTAYGIQVAAYDYNKDSMAGPEYAEAKNWLIANNTIAFNKNRAGVVIWQDGVENCVVQNNIFYKNGGVNGILFYTQQGRRHPVRNNIFYPHGENLVATEDNAYEATDNKQADPRFVDVDSFDFHLKADSPAIDAGTADRAPKTDFKGKSRPQGNKVDIGAYKYIPATGPLRVSTVNPRYFTDGTKNADGSLKVVYLTGSHHWNNLQDSGKLGTPLAQKFDYDGYLGLLERFNHNYIRMWSWEVGENDLYYDPAPWIRTGPGTASDGKPRFDLKRFNPEYFERLRSRVIAAGDRGIYVSVMLFQGWSIYSHGYGNPWPVHPFNEANNINRINGDPDKDGEGREVHTLQVPAVTRLQEAYVRKVIDTINDLDNVLYEITNESAIFSKDWQYHIIRYIKDYEATKPKQHPVGITAFDSGRAGSMQALLESPADWISPQNDGVSGDYQNDPPAADGRKVIISDTDHLWGVGGGRTWVWKSFTRGHHPIYMDPLRKQDWFSISEAEMESARKAMGDTRSYAERINLAAMVPHGELSSTRYCLACAGMEYLIYQPKSGEGFSVELRAGAYYYEWFDPAEGAAVGEGRIDSRGGAQQFKAPFEGEAVLYLETADVP